MDETSIHYWVGGLEHEFYFSTYWEFHHPKSQPTHIFQRGRYTTNQLLYIIIFSFFFPDCRFEQIVHGICNSPRSSVFGPYFSDWGYPGIEGFGWLALSRKRHDFPNKANSGIYIQQ